MRALQEQIARLANMMVQPAQGALQHQPEQQQQQGQQARVSAVVGAQPQEEEPHEEDEEDARSHVSAGSSASSAMRQRVTVERATRRIEQPKPLLWRTERAEQATLIVTGATIAIWMALCQHTSIVLTWVNLAFHSRRLNSY